MNRACMVFTVLAVACGKSPAAKSTAAGTKSGDSTQTSVAMPNPPAASAGALRLVSAGPDDLAGTIVARAALCEDPAVLLVQGNQEGLGALLMLALPAPASRVGRYPVTYSMSGPAKVPVPPAAQLAVQRLSARAAVAFQALEGNVDLYGFGEKVSGRFQVTLREISSSRIDRVAGTFAEVPVQRQPASYCSQLSGPPDSGRGGR